MKNLSALKKGCVGVKRNPPQAKRARTIRFLFNLKIEQQQQRQQCRRGDCEQAQVRHLAPVERNASEKKREKIKIKCPFLDIFRF